MKRIKRGVALACALAAMTTTGGCGKKETAGGEKGNVVFGQDDLKFSYYFHDDGATAVEWPKTEADQWVLDNKKVTIEFIDAGGAASEKLASMIVSDNYPDLICLEKGQESEKLIESGVAVPINEYMEKYTNMRDKLQEKKIFSLFTREDGKIYEIPNWAVVSDHYSGNHCWALNQNVYKELGSPKLEDFDDLYAYLKQVKEKYPDMIPYETSHIFEGERMVLPGMSENLVPTNLDWLSYDDNGELKSIFEHPSYEKAWLFLNKLFREKLMTQDAFSQTADQFKEKLATERVAVSTSTQGYFETARKELLKNGNDYFTITPLKDKNLDRDKVFVSGCDTTGWTEFLITKNAKNPEAIYAFLDWLFTPEGQALELFGVPGKFYDGFNEDGYPEPTDAYINKTADTNVDGLSFILGTTWWDDASMYMITKGLPEDQWPWGGKQQRKNIWPYVKNITEYNGIIPGTETEEGIIYQNIKELHKNMISKMLFASSEEEVKSLIAELRTQSESLGMDRLLEAESKTWKSNKQKLGIE